MTAYVLGFRFRGAPMARQVALLVKTKPTWQAGKLNGIGGKVEETDATTYDAMVREFREETGVDTEAKDWRQFGCLHHDGNDVYLFASEGDANVQTMTAEPVSWYMVSLLQLLPVMPNLLWMVPMALDQSKVTAEIVDTTKVTA
jgi:8-oxo-dGTP diphosphatase